MIVGVRPEHLEVDPEGTLGVDVRAVEWLGHECLISAAVGEHYLTVRQVGMSHDGAGASVRLSAQPGDVVLFDPGTTERIA